MHLSILRQNRPSKDIRRYTSPRIYFSVKSKSVFLKVGMVNRLKSISGKKCGDTLLTANTSRNTPNFKSSTVFLT